VVVLQDVLDAIGAGHQVDRQRANGITHDGAIGPRDLEKEGVRPFAERVQIVDGRTATGSGRVACHVAALWKLAFGRGEYTISCLRHEVLNVQNLFR